MNGLYMKGLYIFKNQNKKTLFLGRVKVFYKEGNQFL